MFLSPVSNTRIIRCLLVSACLFQLSGCATPALLLQRQATSHGFSQHTLLSKGFILTLYNSMPFCTENKVHIYIPGDGTPWVRHNRIALDPTPRYSLTLDLMAMDATSSVYLGRPCYHDQHQAKSCHPLYWTHWRYSDAVVTILSTALQNQLANYPECKVSLIGYSGGATLAMLIAARIEQVTTLVSIAGNLDVSAWSAYHDYTPLRGSLNPAQQASLPVTIRQLHLLGDADDNIPPALMRPAIQHQIKAETRVYKGFTHACCWKTIWPTILQMIE